MVEHKETCQQMEEDKTTNAKLKMMDAPSPVNEAFNWAETAASKFPRFKEFYCSYIKSNLGNFRQKYEHILFSYSMIEQHNTTLQAIHGLFLMLYGGSWVSCATFLSFSIVYQLRDVLGQLESQRKVVEIETVLKTLNRMWLLAIVGYSVWKIPLLAKFTVAFMLEKYVTAFLVSSGIIARVEEKIPLEKGLGM